MNGEENNKSNPSFEQLVAYHEIKKDTRFNFLFKLVLLFYILSILSFLVYLRFEFDSSMELNYFVRLFYFVIASTFAVIGNKIYGNHYAETLEDKKRLQSFVKLFYFYITLFFFLI